jgi:hypothetical protein
MGNNLGNMVLFRFATVGDIDFVARRSPNFIVSDSSSFGDFRVVPWLDDVHVCLSESHGAEV